MSSIKRWWASWLIEILVALPYTPKRSATVDRLLRVVEASDG